MDFIRPRPRSSTFVKPAITTEPRVRDGSSDYAADVTDADDELMVRGDAELSALLAVIDSFAVVHEQNTLGAGHSTTPASNRRGSA